MKPGRSKFKSRMQVVKKFPISKTLLPNRNYGETVIPTGSDNLFIALPKLRDTYTYNIINTDEMSGNITLKTSAGASLRGLVLNTVGGLSIDKIETGTSSIVMESDNADGSYISLLSNGDHWYMWSVVSGGSISLGNVSSGGTGLPPSTTVTYADVTVNANPVDTVSFPAPQLVARHVLTYQGTAEPNATITVTTVATNGGTPVPLFTVTASAIGEWSASFSNILNGTYEFTFTDLDAPNGSGVVSAASDVEETDVGPLSFTTPTSFDLDPGEVFDFAAGASAAEPDGTPIAVTTVSSDFNGKTHGQTFNIVYSFTYLGTPYSRTVSGLVADDTPPSKPVILSATFDAVNLDELTVTGTTDIGTTLKLYKESVYLGDATVNGAGAWTFTTTIGFNQTFNLTAQANDSATSIVGDNRSFPNYSALSDPTAISLSTPTLVRPTLLVTAQQNGVFTNAANDFTLTGTTAIGSIITLFNGSTQIVPTSGPTVDGAGDWTATITALPESINSLTAKATKAGSNENTSSTFSLNVDRVAPVINNNQPLGDLTAYLGNIGDTNDSIPTATDFSSTTVSSDWSTQVDATEGAKTVTYTATDAAGNTATTTRTVNVSTQVIIPTNLVATGGEQQAIIAGDVIGTYADNLDVKIYVTDSNGLEEVYQEIGVDVEFPVNNGVFSASLALSPDTYTFHATTINKEGEESSESQESGPEIITASPSAPSLLVTQTVTLFGTSTLSNGVLDLPGGNGAYATIPGSSDYDPSGGATYSAWVYLDTLKSQQGILSNIFVDTSWKGFSFQILKSGSFPNGYFRVACNAVSGNQQINDAPAGGISTGAWHHVAATFNPTGGECIAYFNGVALNQTLSNANIEHDDAWKFYIGAQRDSGGTNYTIDGQIKRVLIEQTVKSPSELLTIYNAGHNL